MCNEHDMYIYNIRPFGTDYLWLLCLTPSICLSDFSPSPCISVYLYICLSDLSPVYLTYHPVYVYLFIWLTTLYMYICISDLPPRLSVYLTYHPVYLFIWLTTLFICLSDLPPWPCISVYLTSDPVYMFIWLTTLTLYICLSDRLVRKKRAGHWR